MNWILTWSATSKEIWNVVLPHVLADVGYAAGCTAALGEGETNHGSAGMKMVWICLCILEGV